MKPVRFCEAHGCSNRPAVFRRCGICQRKFGLCVPCSKIELPESVQRQNIKDSVRCPECFGSGLSAKSVTRGPEMDLDDWGSYYDKARKEREES